MTVLVPRATVRRRAPVPSPAHAAVAGFGVAGALLVALDLGHPAAVVTDTISSHAAGPLRFVFVIALLASCAGMGAGIACASRSTRYRRGDLALLTFWPVAIGVATLFDQAEHTVTGTIHNVAAGTAIVAVHVAAARARTRWVRLVAVVGFGVMALLLAMIVVDATIVKVPFGIVERVLITVSAVIATGALARPTSGPAPAGGARRSRRRGDPAP